MEVFSIYVYSLCFDNLWNYKIKISFLKYIFCKLCVIWYPCYIPKFTFLFYLIILQENFIFSLSLLSYIIIIIFDIHLLKNICVLHCFYDLATQFYIVLCCLIFILHDNFILKDKNFFLCMWQLKSDYMQGHIWKGYSTEWSPRIVIQKNV